MRPNLFLQPHYSLIQPSPGNHTRLMPILLKVMTTHFYTHFREGYRPLPRVYNCISRASRASCFARAQFTRDRFLELGYLVKSGLQIRAVAVPERSRRKRVRSKYRRPFPARTLEPIPQSPMAEDFGRRFSTPTSHPASRVYFKSRDAADGEGVVRAVVPRRTPLIRSISFRRLGFWVFSALSAAVLAMAFEVTKGSGESWIRGFGAISYETLCSEAAKTSDTTMITMSETSGIMSQSWCTQYSTFIDLQNAAAIICGVATAFAFAAFLSPRTMLMGYVVGILMFLYAAAQLSAIVLIGKIKDSIPNSVRGVFEWEVDDDELSYGPTFSLAIAACTLAAVDAVIILALVRSAGIGPIYALLNRYGLGCCDMPLEEDDNELNPPPPYEP